MARQVFAELAAIVPLAFAEVGSGGAIEGRLGGPDHLPRTYGRAWVDRNSGLYQKTVWWISDDAPHHTRPGWSLVTLARHEIAHTLGLGHYSGGVMGTSGMRPMGYTQLDRAALGWLYRGC